MKCALKSSGNNGRSANHSFAVFFEDSPSTEDQVILRFYKNKDAVELGKEIGREQISISAQNFCGISLAYRYSKNPYVLTVICLDFVILLSFESHDQLLNWYHKIQNTLPSATAFQTPVIVPNQPSKIHPGRALLHFYDNHFALTPEIPKELIKSWSLSTLQKYTSVGDSIFFSSTTSKGEKSFVLVTKDTTVADNLKNHFDLATSVQPPRERQSYIANPGFQQIQPSNSGVSSSNNGGGGHGNHGSQNGGIFVHKRNQDEYGVQEMLPNVNGDICRANSCSEHGSQKSFGSRRQFEELRGRTNSHDSSSEPSVFDPLLKPLSSSKEQQNCIPMHGLPSNSCSECHGSQKSFGSRRQFEELRGRTNSHDSSSEPSVFDPLLKPLSSSKEQQNCIPMHGLPSSSLPSGAAVAANGHGDFGFWKPSYSHQEETMFLYECTSGSPAPVREQNYEVMNLFDHIRHKHDRDHGAASQSCQRAGCSKCGDAGASVVVHQGHGEEGFSNEETRYMNLFTRRADGHIPPSVPLSPLFIPQHSEARDDGSPTLSHNSYSFLPNKQIVNLNGTELPSPAVVISATALVPVPFDHESLVKPSGPISMLKSPNGPNKSSEGSSAAATDKVESKEVKEARSVASGASSVETGSKTTTSHYRQRQNSFPAENSLRMPRKYSMPPVSGNLLADTRQNSYDLQAQPPELPPRIPPREPFLPSPPPYGIRQRCYTDSVYAVKGARASGAESDGGYLMMKPAYDEKLQTVPMRSRSVASSPVDVAIPTSPLGVASRVYNNRYLGVWDRRNVSPSLTRSYSGKVDPHFRLLKRSATVATNLTRQGRDLSVSTRRGSMPSPGGSRINPKRSFSTVTSHVPRPRTSRDYATINPESIAQKAQGSSSRRCSQENILSCEHSFNFSDTSGSGADITHSSSSLSDLSSQASNSRASSFGSQSGVGLLYQRGCPTNKDCKDDIINDVNGNR